MKSTSILCGALVAITTLANPIAQHHFCWLIGQSCNKEARSLEQLSSTYVKRAAEAAQNACWLPGQDCDKAGIAKRDASPEAAADAEAISLFCSRSGQPCDKLKRVANAVAEAMALPDALPGSEDVNGTVNNYCYGSEQPCALARRSALALAQSLPITPKRALGLPFADGRNKHHFCWLSGETCQKLKREVLTSAEKLADVEHEFLKRDVEYDAAAAQQYCDSEAGPCSELKRFAAALVDAISEPEVTARAVESEDEALKERCYAAGGPCDLGKRMVEEVELMLAQY